MTQNSEFKLKYPFLYKPGFSNIILLAVEPPPPHLFLLKYYTELHDTANLSSAGMFETDLETQSPTHWLCLWATLLSTPSEDFQERHENHYPRNVETMN